MTADYSLYIERYGCTWIQHSDGLYYRPPYPGNDEQVDRAYPSARRQAAMETGLSPKIFPVMCPWTVAQLQDLDFLPEGSVDRR
jgi:Domain of unknown function DUF29